MLKKKIAVLTTAMVLICSAVAYPETKRIWCVGDSITLGTALDSDNSGQYDFRPTYRYGLYTQMTAAGWDFDMVGTQFGYGSGVLNGDVYAECPDWLDQDHDGWSGFTSQEVLYGWSSGQGTFAGIDDEAANMNPDIVLLHIGTNDQYRGLTLQQSQTSIENIITTIRNVNPHAEFFVAAIIPCAERNTWHDEIDALGSWIANNIESFSTENSPVYMVDMHTGYNNIDWYAATDMLGNNDGVHPDSYGEAFIADRWFEALDTYSSIPEPCTIMMLVLGCFPLICRKKQ